MLGYRLKNLREEKHLNQEQLAKILKVSPSSIGMYETDKREPSDELKTKIAEIFNVSVDFLVGKEEKIYNILPVVGKVSAGQPILADENIIEYVKVSPEVYGISNPEEYFYLIVNGESMNLIMHNGEYALIHKQSCAETGDIVVAIVNDNEEAVIKKYKKINDELVVLEPVSTLPIEPIYINLKEKKLLIIGKAISHFGKL